MKTDPAAPSKPSVPKPPSGKVFDVRRPGRAPASATSKPVIVGHKPQIKDPSVTISGIGESRQIMNSRQKIDVKPTDGSLKASSPNVSVNIPAAHIAPKVDAAPKAQQSDTGPAGQLPAYPAIPEPAASSSPGTPKADTQDIDALGQVAIDNTDATKRDAAILDLYADASDADLSMPQEDIIVSHHRNGGAAWKIAILIVVIILLAVAAFDILLDAGIITIPGVPHTHFLR